MIGLLQEKSEIENSKKKLSELNFNIEEISPSTDSYQRRTRP
jgi:hypothetical protein